MKRWWSFAVILVLFGGLTVSAQEAPRWKLTSAQNLGDLLGDLARVAVVSPDGSMIAWLGNQELCLYRLADQTNPCYPFPETYRSKPASFVWSPDSTRLAFTEDVFRFLDDGDIWLFNATNQTFADLTDDGNVERSFIDPEFTGLVDYLPIWQNNDSLYFFSSKRGAERLTLTLNRLLLSTREIKMRGNFTDDLPVLSIFRPPAISPDGNQMAVIVLGQELDDTRNGIWLIGLNDKSIQQIATLPDFQVGLPAWHEGRVRPLPEQIDWAGTTGLVVTARDLQYVTVQPAQNIYYVDLLKNKVTPLVDFSSVPDQKSMFKTGADDHTPIYTIPRIGVVAPDGKTLLYLHFDFAGDADTRGGISALALPPDGSAPQFLGNIPGFQIGPPDYASASTNGWAIMYNQLLKFEQE